MSDKSAANRQAIVVGGGPAGLTAAISLAAGGIRTNLVRLRPTRPDNRTTALLAGSVAALEALDIWRLCADKAAPLRIIRIVDDTGRLWRAPEVKFSAQEIDRDAFGYNIENRHLVDALEERARGLPALQMIDDEVLSIEPKTDGVVANLRQGETLRGSIVVGADGRKSVCRAAAGIALDERSYPQVALTLCFSHTRSHHNTSTEFHRSSGPFTLGNLQAALAAPLDRRGDELVVEHPEHRELAGRHAALHRVRGDLLGQGEGLGAELGLHHAPVVASGARVGRRIAARLLLARKNAARNRAVRGDAETECARRRQHLHLQHPVHDVVVGLEHDRCRGADISARRIDRRDVPRAHI